MKKIIRLFKPYIGQEELISIKRVFKKSWLGIGKEVKKFEDKFSKKFKVKYSLATNSGTSALNLALKYFNFPQGKYVMVNNITFAASATCILNNNLKPLFIDCDPKNLSFDLEDAKKKIKKNVVAIVVVHFGGHPANIVDILRFAKKYKLKVIEDCAHSQGGSINGKILGTWGDIGCFSFEEKKGMTTGDGGMIVTKKFSIYKTIKQMRWIGINKGTWERSKSNNNTRTNDNHWKYEINMLGDKMHMNDLSAAIGLEQLKKLEYINKKKREFVELYRKKIILKNDLRFLIEDYNKQSVYWLFGLKTKYRDKYINILKKNGISTGVHHIPLTNFRVFKKYKNYQKISSKMYNQILSLPLHADLTKKDVEYICNVINKIKL